MINTITIISNGFKFRLLPNLIIEHLRFSFINLILKETFVKTILSFKKQKREDIFETAQFQPAIKSENFLPNK